MPFLTEPLSVMTVHPHTIARLTSGHLVWVEDVDEHVARVTFLEQFRATPETVPAADLAPAGNRPAARRSAAGPQFVPTPEPVPAR